jgi:hypothetical protein
VRQLVEAARLLPGCDFTIAGDDRRCAAGLIASSPRNVRFTGYLRGDDYRDAFRAADVVVSLTNRAEATCRTAYEAVYALRPLVTSDWPQTRRVFPYAVHVENDPASIAAGIARAVAEHPRQAERATVALGVQRERVSRQLEEVRSALGLRSDGPGRFSRRPAERPDHAQRVP